MADGQDAQNVWDADFKMVHHLNTNPSDGLDYQDSTTNDNDATRHGDHPGGNSITGIIGLAGDFDGDNDWIEYPQIQPLDEPPWTFSIWFKLDHLPSGDDNDVEILKYYNDVVNDSDIHIYLDGVGSGNYEISYYDGNSGNPRLRTGVIVAADAWYHVTAVYSGTSGSSELYSLYVNGELKGSTDGSSGSAPLPDGDGDDGTKTWQSFKNPSTHSRAWGDGILDEARFSDAVRSSDWISMQYASMTDNFITYQISQTVESVSFTQTLPMQSQFVMPVSAEGISLTTYITVAGGGTLSANPALTATLYNGSTAFITMTRPTAVLENGAYRVNWNENLAQAVTITAGSGITLEIQSAESGELTLLYDSPSRPSFIKFPAANIINIEALDIYDAAYSGGTAIDSAYVGQTVYVRGEVSDPFGYYDIVTGTLVITSSCNTAQTFVMTNTYAVSMTGATKIYEYPWKIPNCRGTFTATLTSFEGYEGLTDSALVLFVGDEADTGTPSKTEFQDEDGDSTSAYAPNEKVCVQVTDIDEAGSGPITVTVTSASGDSEVHHANRNRRGYGRFHSMYHGK